MTKERSETNPEVRQNRTPGEESRRKHHWKSKSDERAVAVTGIREKAMRSASVDELETSSSTARWPSPGEAENDRTGKANEFVRSLLVKVKKEGDTIVGRDMSLKRATQNWNMKHVDVVRSRGSATRVFTSSE